MTGKAGTEHRKGNLQAQFEGLIFGAAVGDSVGLPAEGLSPETIQKLGWGAWKHRLCFSRGVFSDDTEHLFLVGQSILEARGDGTRFAICLARRLRWWLSALPPGTGLGTARALVKSWMGWSPQNSGVYSAGNGPAMRAGLIGCIFQADDASVKEWIAHSTLITHSDPRAYRGALAIAQVASMIANQQTIDLDRLIPLESDDEWRDCIHRIKQAVSEGWTLHQFAKEIGCEHGISGYIYHTVPVAIFAILIHRHTSFEECLESVWSLGGDVDTVGAVTGALAGLHFGKNSIPMEWLKGISDWPLSLATLQRLCAALAAGSKPVKWAWPLLPFRNLIVLMIVLSHGFSRLIPVSLRRRLKNCV